MDWFMLIFIGLVAFCIGLFIGKASPGMDGMFIVNEDDTEVTRWILDVNIDPNTIPNKKEIRLKVRKMSDTE